MAVSLEGFRTFGREMESLAAIETGILYDTGALISALPMPEKSYEDRTGLMHEVQREGIDL